LTHEQQHPGAPRGVRGQAERVVTHAPKALPVPERRFLVFLALLVLGTHMGVVLGTGTLGKTLLGYDEQYYFAILRSMVIDHDFDFSNEFNLLTPIPKSIDRVIVPATGRYANKYGVGWALWALPPYAVVHLVMTLVSDRPPTGYEPPYQAAAALAHSLAAALCLIFAYLIARRFASAESCVSASLFIALGTPLLYYGVYEVHMAHAVGAMAVTMLIHSAVRLAEQAVERGGGRAATFALAGLAWSLASVSRYSNALFGLVLIYPVWVHLNTMAGRSGRRRALLVGAAALALGAVGPALVQVAQWKAIYGTWWLDPYGRGGEGFHWASPHLWSFLFSHRHGVLFSSPLVVLSWAGLAWCVVRPRSASMSRSLAVPLALTAALPVYVGAAWHMWWFGAGFGCRAYVEATPLLVAGFAVALDQVSGWTRGVVWLGALVSVFWTNAQLLLLIKKQLAWDGGTTGAEIVERISRLMGL